jgi:hypothetical protein
MIADFPTHTIVMIILVGIATAFGGWLAFSETLTELTVSPKIKRNIRVGAALVLIAIFVVRWLLAVNSPGDWVLSPAFAIGYTAVVIAIGSVPLLLSASFRRVVAAIPLVWLVALHVMRIEGGYFLTLLDSGLLPSEFALPAGYGDIGVAILSAVLAYFILTRRPGIRLFLIVWNILSFVDFTSAFITGAQYIAPFATARQAAGHTISYVNYVLIIPTVVVPILALLNIYTLYKLATGLKNEARPPGQALFSAEYPVGQASIT